jgi:predicted anti-sigma-YlaC factor YlaD
MSRPGSADASLRVLCRIVILTTAMATSWGCSIKTLAVKTVANTLSEPGDTFTRDDDPELIRAALPFGLKTFESLLESVPRHRPLLIATCSGFTSYAYAFVEADADLLGSEDFDKARELREQALRLYLRARGYCWRALDLRFKGIAERLKADPAAALARARKEDVPLLYWSAASLGAAISLAKGRPELLVDLPVVRAMIERALALDEPWGNGSLHELMITIESQGEAFGGSEERARTHFARAVELQKGRSAGPYLSLAMNVSRSLQDRAEFERLLNQALAIDPAADKSNQLITIIAQRRAKSLLARVDDLFIQ